MANRHAAKDLFGNRVRSRRPRYEASLERSDKASRPARAARMRWLAQVIPKNRAYMMPMETFYVFNEAESSFVFGNYVAVIALATSFVEHWFSAKVSVRGFAKEAAKGLGASVKVARENGLVDECLLRSVDRLRLIRNPFMHLKSFEHEHSINQRSLKHRLHPDELLEKDAKDAITTMYSAVLYSFRRP